MDQVDIAERLACFLAQQTAEKAIKGFLYAQGEEVVFGHSVERLGTAASVYKPDLKDAVKRWGILDTYYIPTRYPNGLPDSIPAKVYNQDIAKTAAALAEEVVIAMRTELDRMEIQGS